jgi:tetratricopeptide (TPR) repeat protein
VASAGLGLTLAAALQAQEPHAGHGSAAGGAVPGIPGATVPLYDNLGDLHREIETRVPLAQRYFDQGLRLTYAFNHAEAVASFRQAAALDSTCAMCYWGIALALGPNINAPMDSASGAAAYQAAQTALRLSGTAGPVHQGFIRALAQRYGSDPTAGRQALDSTYARAMRDLTSRRPDDAEAQVLFAEAVMLLSPWNYWAADRLPRPGTEEILGRLEAVVARTPNHPGGCHFYIHAVEAAYPDRAVACAERLAALMPGAGHLVHMPGHIYIRVGRWLDAIRANEHAVHADETWMQDRRPAAGLYTVGYYPHNYDFLAFASAMVGRRQQALDAADRVASLVPAELLGTPGMTLMQLFVSRPFQLRVRFELWQEILAAPAPAEDLVFARAMWHYARGRALLAGGDVAGAVAELARVRAAAADRRLEGVALEFNQTLPVLRIAAGVLAGRVAAVRGDVDRAVAYLRDAAREEDELAYGEPPEWTLPVRQELGEVLLAAGRAGEAEAAYRQDLERFPRNVWSLAGLAKSLDAQGRAAEADRVRATQ